MAWSQWKQRFSDSYLHPRFLAKRALQQWVASEAPAARGRLLDVGCGRKPYAALFSHVTSHIGLDVPSSMHGLAQVDVAGVGWALPFCAGAFDTVLCTEVLEHTPEPLLVLAEMGRVSKPAGLLLLTVPLSEQLHEEPYDYYRFTRYSLSYLLQKSGWRVVHIRERGGAWLELGYRLSSFLYSSIGATTAEDGTLATRPILGPPVIVLCALVQMTAALLNRLWPSRLSTIGYGVVAQKGEGDAR
jgi:SAM-dependent methyltransferase